MRRIRLDEWLARREEAREELALIRAGFGDYRRDRPRDREKARLLRERGTPEHLIGSEAGDVEAQRASRRQRDAG